MFSLKLVIRQKGLLRTKFISDENKNPEKSDNYCSYLVVASGSLVGSSEGAYGGVSGGGGGVQVY